MATRGAQFDDLSLKNAYRNVSVVPFKFYGYILVVRVNNPAPLTNRNLSRRRPAFLHPYSEDTSLNYPSWVGSAYWLYLQASISIFEVAPCSPLTTSPHPRAALGGVILFGSTTATTSNHLMFWNIAYTCIANVSLETNTYVTMVG